MTRINHPYHGEYVKILFSKEAYEARHKKIIAADSATQATVFPMRLIHRCFNVRKSAGSILTETGE